MSEQSNLFDDGLPHQRHSETSRSAAEAAAGGARSQRKAVFDLLKANEQGLTDEEIQRMLAMNPSTERPRRIELLYAGLVMDSGEVRRTLSGRKAVVWRRKPPKKEST